MNKNALAAAMDKAVRTYVRSLRELGISFQYGPYKAYPYPGQQGITLPGDYYGWFVSSDDNHNVALYSSNEHACRIYADEANLIYAEHLMTLGTAAEPRRL